jgi:radical SAM protein with 4Fe4S-binding SPASM domain
VEKPKKDAFIRQFKEIGLDELVIKKPHNWAGSLHLQYSRKNYSPCTFLWNALLVLWNGDVAPCAQDFFAKYKLGNVSEKSLVSIWNDEPMKTLRRGLKEGRYKEFPACADCDRLWRDTFLGIPKEYLKKFILKRMP